MKRAASGPVLAVVLAVVLVGCAPKGPAGVDAAALNDAVGSAIGDPNTCVLLVERGGDVVWRMGSNMTCARARPSCQGPQAITVEDLAKAAAAGETRNVSCPGPNGLVGWSAGPVPAGEVAKQGQYAYAAGMIGERALPGREIARRLEGALRRAGL